MSDVTNIILQLPLGDDEDKIDAINQFCRDAYNGQCFSPDLNKWDDVGGHKFLECNLFVAAFNLLDLQALIDFLATLPWESDPYEVQLMVCEQEDNAFQSFHLGVGEPELTPITERYSSPLWESNG